MPRYNEKKICLHYINSSMCVLYSFFQFEQMLEACLSDTEFKVTLFRCHWEMVLIGSIIQSKGVILDLLILH